MILIIKPKIEFYFKCKANFFSSNGVCFQNMTKASNSNQISMSKCCCEQGFSSNQIKFQPGCDMNSCPNGSSCIQNRCLFSIKICSGFVKKNLDRLLKNLKYSWQSVAVNIGHIKIVYVEHTELISDTQ